MYYAHVRFCSNYKQLCIKVYQINFADAHVLVASCCYTYPCCYIFACIGCQWLLYISVLLYICMYWLLVVAIHIGTPTGELFLLCHVTPTSPCLVHKKPSRKIRHMCQTLTAARRTVKEKSFGGRNSVSREYLRSHQVYEKSAYFLGRKQFIQPGR